MAESDTATGGDFDGGFAFSNGTAGGFDFSNAATDFRGDNLWGSGAEPLSSGGRGAGEPEDFGGVAGWLDLPSEHDSEPAETVQQISSGVGDGGNSMFAAFPGEGVGVANGSWVPVGPTAVGPGSISSGRGVTTATGPSQPQSGQGTSPQMLSGSLVAPPTVLSSHDHSVTVRGAAASLVDRMGGLDSSASIGNHRSVTENSDASEERAVNFLRQWEENHELELQKEREEEDRKKGEIRRKAAEDLKKWHEDREIQIRERTAAQRAAEERRKEGMERIGSTNSGASFGDEIEAVSDGNDKLWTSVCRLIDFQKEIPSQRDTTYLRQLLTRLKVDERREIPGN